jgi:hypothetical protein
MKTVRIKGIGDKKEKRINRGFALTENIDFKLKK